MSTLTFDRRPLTWQLQTGRTDDVVTDQLVARTWLASMVPGVLLAIAIVIGAAGLVCAAMAQAFAHGIKLVDDVEGLV